MTTGIAQGYHVNKYKGESHGIDNVKGIELPRYLE